MKENTKRDIHIEILKYARKNVEFTSNQLMADLGFNQNEKDLFVQRLINEKSLIANTGRNIKTQVGEEGVYYISTEGRFKLLEYEQLNEARQSSKEAQWFAIAAILLSTLASFIQIYISICNNK